MKNVHAVALGKRKKQKFKLSMDKRRANARKAANARWKNHKKHGQPR